MSFFFSFSSLPSIIVSSPKTSISIRCRSCWCVSNFFRITFENCKKTKNSTHHIISDFQSSIQTNTRASVFSLSLSEGKDFLCSASAEIAPRKFMQAVRQERGGCCFTFFFLFSPTFLLSPTMITDIAGIWWILRFSAGRWVHSTFFWMRRSDARIFLWKRAWCYV